MKRSLLLLLLFIIGTIAYGQTSISGSTISGHWNLSGSPYIVHNDLYIPAGDSLIIDAGVDVQFAGLYRLDVAGVLYANGTESAPILFHAQDTTGWHIDTSPAGGWVGLYFQSFSDTGSLLQYCNISDCKYGSDTAYATGSGTITAYKQVAFKNCDIFHNQGTAPLCAGTLLSFAIYYSYVTIEHCKIHDNVSTYSTMFFSNGGGMSVYLANNEVYNNTANLPIWMLNVSVDIENNNLHDNHCLISGGTLNLEDSCTGIIKGNKIHHNTAETEAALRCISSVLDINSNLICNNKSSAATCGLVDGGGAIQLSGNGTGPVGNYLVRNNVIANNHTDFNGGAFCIIYTNVDIMNNTIVNNSAGTGGGIHIMDNSETVNIKNNILYGNVMNTGVGLVSPSVYMFDGYQLSFENNWTQHCFAQEVGSVTTYTLLGDTVSNLAGLDAMLAVPTTTSDYTEDATTADFSLQASSPCIDAGDTTGAFPYAYDYAGNPRITGSRIDIGAYESLTATTSVAQHSAAHDLAIFPNPAHEALNVSLPEATGVIEITNSVGAIVISQIVIHKLSSVNVQLLPAGVYFMKWVDAKNNITTSKFIKE